MKNGNITCVFFGTSVFSTIILEALLKEKLKPSCIVTAPDRPAGRGMRLTPPPVKVWAERNKITVLQPNKLDGDFISDLQPTTYNLENWDVFVTAAYGKILPHEIITIPTHGTLNVHPSLLPHHRGPSPVEVQILADDPDDVGVSIMLLDEKMDHGPLLGQTQLTLEDWPPTKTELETILAHEGGALLAYLLPQWVRGRVEATAQDHTQATYTKLIEKKHALLDLESGNQRLNYLKIKAYDKNPRAHFVGKNGKRIGITDAKWKDDTLIITKVIPEGKKEMDYWVFQKSLS